MKKKETHTNRVKKPRREAPIVHRSSIRDLQMNNIIDRAMAAEMRSLNDLRLEYEVSLIVGLLGDEPRMLTAGEFADIHTKGRDWYRQQPESPPLSRDID